MKNKSNRKKIKIDFFIARIARFPRQTSGIMRKLMRHENIVPTVLYIFPKVLTRRICLTIKSFFSWWLVPLFLWPWCVIQGWYREEKLDAYHSTGLRVKLQAFALQQSCLKFWDFQLFILTWKTNPSFLKIKFLNQNTKRKSKLVLWIN